ncbi:hypothetical protein K458DRAFT_392012 [Lentithecium fluviatile CBS 122367]|uniref:RING-type domain-containing protein n=1 Tax=Lentithecium fluviatile CBS 122367 TaxID=1168545 RepID=A0A6G1ITB3_9PLEO|nr:hypothetical protein K458DRAFT_392012 [Lentithecium fluviatile CBS 122367]
MPSSPISRPASANCVGFDDDSGVPVDTPPATPPRALNSDSTLQSSPVSVHNIDPSLTWEARPAIGVKDTQPVTAAASHPLPNLLRYVDNDLLRRQKRRDLQPDTHAICPVCCHSQIQTAFMCLSPCGCWVHYRCFIWRASLETRDHDCCPSCNMRLFQWEGITALTLMTRTGLEMEDKEFPTHLRYVDSDTGQFVYSLYSEYVAECSFIEIVIHRNFHQVLADRSLDLTLYYYNVLADLDRSRKVRSKWLSWHTALGYYLFGMLVAIKTRRYLLERYEHLQSTLAWKKFEEGRLMLQGKIREQVEAPIGYLLVKEEKERDGVA